MAYGCTHRPSADWPLACGLLPLCAQHLTHTVGFFGSVLPLWMAVLDILVLRERDRGVSVQFHMAPCRNSQQHGRSTHVLTLLREDLVGKVRPLSNSTAKSLPASETAVEEPFILVRFLDSHFHKQNNVLHEYWHDTIRQLSWSLH